LPEEIHLPMVIDSHDSRPTPGSAGPVADHPDLIIGDHPTAWDR
jgi:hypothetical protein